MPSTPRQTAEAFSRHDFPASVPYLADTVRWTLVGEDVIEGRAAVVAACEQSAAGLVGVKTTFERFKVVVGDAAVVVDTIGRYVDGDGAESVVSSCDLYDFQGDTVTAITSYAVELTD